MGTYDVGGVGVWDALAAGVAIPPANLPAGVSRPTVPTSGGSSTIAVVGHTSIRGAVATPAINTTGANLLVWGVSTYSSGSGAMPSDSYSNTWVQIGSLVGNASRDFASFWYVANPIVGTGHIFTCASGNGAGCLLAVSGASTAPADQFNGTAYLGDGVTTTRATGPVSPTKAFELFVAFLAVDDPSGSTFSIDGGYTIVETIDVAVGSTFGAVLAYKVQSGAAIAESPTFTRSVPTNAARYDNAIIACFKGQ